MTITYELAMKAPEWDPAVEPPARTFAHMMRGSNFQILGCTGAGYLMVLFDEDVGIPPGTIANALENISAVQRAFHKEPLWRRLLLAWKGTLT